MKTRSLPNSVYVLTPEEERNYDRGGYDREDVMYSLSHRFGEPGSLPVADFTEVRRRDGRVIERFKGKE